MTAATLGDKLYRITNQTMNVIFEHGKLAQLSHTSFVLSVNTITGSSDEVFTLNFPIGRNPDGTTLNSDTEYPKKELINQYTLLATHTLPLMSLYRLVTVMEAMWSDIIKAIILTYPKKLSGKKKIDLASVLESTSIEAIHIVAIDSLLNELAYNSPKDYADEMKKIININLLEIPAYHTYIEVKATRDIHIHNRGVANNIYLEKAGTHARVGNNQALPVTVDYFLQAYEACLQITEILRDELHKTWASMEYEKQKLAKLKKKAAKKKAVKKKAVKKKAVKKKAVKK